MGLCGFPHRDRDPVESDWDSKPLGAAQVERFFGENGPDDRFLGHKKGKTEREMGC